MLMYHLVFLAKYRRAIFDLKVDYVNFLVQSVPTYSITKLVTMIKSLTARHIFKECPEVKKFLWGGNFWSDVFFANTVVSMVMNQ